MLNMQKEKQRLKQLAAELVAMREVFSKAGTCGSSSLMVVTGGTLVIQLPSQERERLGAEQEDCYIAGALLIAAMSKELLFFGKSTDIKIMT